MDGSEIRRAREAEKAGQIPFAARCGIARSQLQHLEATGNSSIATLERVVANLPALRSITLGGRQFIAVDALAADLGRLIDDARQLSEIVAAVAAAPAPAPVEPQPGAAPSDDDARAAAIAAATRAAASRRKTPPETEPSGVIVTRRPKGGGQSH